MEPVEEKKELHPAVALLLKRMDSNPQEFLKGEWDNAEEAIAAYATDEEKKLVAEKLGKLWMDHTHEAMLKRLFKVEEDDKPMGEQYGNKFTDPRNQYQHVQVGSGGIYVQDLARQEAYQTARDRQEFELQKRALDRLSLMQGMGLAPTKTEGAPKKPYLGQIIRGPRPLSILKGFFKGGA
jgi:hypothetical protein